MSVYNSNHQGQTIDNGIIKANKLPNISSGNVGQFLKKANSSGDMIWDDVVSVTTQMNSVENTNMENLFLFFTNKIVQTIDWIEDTPYEEYPYYAIISCPNLTSNYYPEVIFNLQDAKSGYFAPICESMTDGIKIFASDIIEENVIIPTIICIKGN